MDKQTIFKDLARYYDLLYAWKDYEQEAAKIRRLIARHQKSSGRDLLEVACGTGRHAARLKNDFSIVATDLNEGMLRIARRRCKGVRFRRADMTTLDLGRTFDVIVCLFGSIGYVRTYANLKKTIGNFARHLKPGGVLILEPWFTKANFKAGAPRMTVHDGPDIKIARAVGSEVRGGLSILDMHYLVAERNKPVRFYVDRHELGLFDRRKTLAYLRRAGLNARFQGDGLMKGRGLYIGVRT
jgi:SAM-dependent methyltransferase